MCSVSAGYSVQAGAILAASLGTFGDERARGSWRERAFSPTHQLSISLGHKELRKPAQEAFGVSLLPLTG